jgi:O-antigen/teichoic acid export membrane protein/Ser/Thr protein kinase RdoA (MazF antagonist)
MPKVNRLAILARVDAGRRLFFSDSLFRNATYLMASTAVMSVLGFFFWVFVAHLYDPADIGVASALIAIATLISNFSLLGLNYGLIRFLSSSKAPSRDINAAAVVVAGMTIFAAAAYALIGTRIGGDIELLEGVWHKFAFIVLMSAVSLNSLTDAVFIANRRGEYHTIGYATFGLVKLILPLLLVPFGSLGIFGAYIMAMLASLIVSYYLMRRGCGYRIRTKPDWTLLKSVRRYTFHNYVGVVLAGLPVQLMPLLIIRHLGAPAVAFFSMAWTMVNLLYVVPSAVTQSLLAESSFDSRKKKEHLRRTIILLTLLLVPAVTVAIVVSPYLLTIFGQQYRQNGTTIFQILSVATFFVAINAVGNTILNIEKRTGGIVAVQLATMLATGSAAIFLIRFGLTGVGLSFLIGNVASSLTLGVLWLGRPKPNSVVPSFPAGNAELQTLLQPYGISDFTAAPLGNGSDNCTLLIRTPAQRYVLRIYRPDGTKDDDIEQEISYMDYLAANHLRTPLVIGTKAGKKLLHCALQGNRWQYILMEFVPGHHPTEYDPPLLEHMANQQALLHVKGLEYARGTAAHRRHVPRSLQVRQSLLQALAPAGFSHFDYDASNLLVYKGQISCILDFEGMRYGPLVSCLYFTLSQIYDRHQKPEMLASYLAAYEQTRKLNPGENLIIRVSLALRHRNPALLRV